MTSLTLTHWSPDPFVLDTTRTYSQEDFGNGKPRGLWLSDESGDPGWREWCESEEFHCDGLAHATQFRLAESSRVLVLASPADLRAFTDAYKQSIQPGLRQHWIDWERVAEKHSGVLITPYQWECRLDFDMMWYYGWDCASACIWDLTAIERIEVTA